VEILKNQLAAQFTTENYCTADICEFENEPSPRRRSTVYVYIYIYICRWAQTISAHLYLQQKFSKVSLLLNLLRKMTTELTFEKISPHKRMRRRPSPLSAEILESQLAA